MEYSVRLPSFLFPVYQLTLRQSQEYDENYRKIFFMLTDKENCMPTVLIDADGCPVVDLTIRTCRRRGVPVLILCDTAHRIERDGAETLVFDKGADSVDFALVNRVRRGDIVVTQDYGLAGMCLARLARALNQNGLEYTAGNIDTLLDRRWRNKKLLRAGKHPKGPSKRTSEQDDSFIRALERILAESL